MRKFVSSAAALTLILSAVAWAQPSQAAATQNPYLKGVSLFSPRHHQYQAHVVPQAGDSPQVLTPNDLYYAFKVESPSGQWRVVQPYSNNPNFTFWPSGGSHGLYFIQALALTRHQYAVGDWSQAVSSSPLPVAAPNRNPNISALTSEGKSVDSFVFGASVRPANMPVEYQVELRLPSGKLSLIHPYSATKTLTYMPHASGEGLIVAALTKSQVEAKKWNEAVEIYVKLVMAPTKKIQPDSNPAFLQPGVVNKGRRNIFHAGSAPKPRVQVEYAFRVETPTGQMIMAQNYSPDPWFVYNPPASGYHVQILALTSYQVKHQQWNLAETSGFIAVPAVVAPSSAVADAQNSTTTAVVGAGIPDTLDVTINGQNGQGMQNEPVSFVSSNPQVASPNTYAVLTDMYGQATMPWTPKSPGTATITATCDGQSATFVVTVEKLIPTVQLLLGNHATGFENTYMWSLQVTDQLHQLVAAPPTVTIVDTSQTPEVTYSLANNNLTVAQGQVDGFNGPAYEVTVTPQGPAPYSDNLVMTVDGVTEAVHF